MSNEEIIALLKSTGTSDFTNCGGFSRVTYLVSTEQAIAFANLIANRTREEDAAICDEYDKEYGYGPAYYCAQAIRARMK